jgi:hypothetical protein
MVPGVGRGRGGGRRRRRRRRRPFWTKGTERTEIDSACCLLLSGAAA